MRRLFYCALFAASTALTGCETFGFSSPTSPLLREAKDFRNTAPVPAPVARELSKELLPTYIVEPGDTLLVQPVEFDSPVRMPPDQVVLQDGSIDLGIYGRPVVSGKTLAQIEPQVQDLVNAKERDRQKERAVLNKEKEPDFRPVSITVRLIGRVSKVYYVLGEVNVPNAYPITGRETVLDALVQAGGLNRKAARNMIVVSRPRSPDGCRIVLPVCYDQIVQLGDTSTNYQLHPGDRVFVPSQGTFASITKFFCRKCVGPCCRPQVSCFGGGCAETAVPCGTSTPQPTPTLPVAPASTTLPLPDVK